MGGAVFTDCRDHCQPAVFVHVRMLNLEFNNRFAYSVRLYWCHPAGVRLYCIYCSCLTCWSPANNLWRSLLTETNHWLLALLPQSALLVVDKPAGTLWQFPTILVAICQLCCTLPCFNASWIKQSWTSLLISTDRLEPKLLQLDTGIGTLLFAKQKHVIQSIHLR